MRLDRYVVQSVGLRPVDRGSGCRLEWAVLLASRRSARAGGAGGQGGRWGPGLCPRLSREP